MCNSWSPRHNGDIFSGLNDGILSRAEALAAVDIGKHQGSHAHTQMTQQLKHDVMYHHSMGAPPQRPLQNKPYSFQMHHTMDGIDMLDPSGSMTTLTPMSEAPITSSHHQLHGSYHSMNHMMGHHHSGPLGGHTPDGFLGSHHPAMAVAVAAAGLHPDTDTDPRELEAFAERFKQRRIKLGKRKIRTYRKSGSLPTRSVKCEDLITTSTAGFFTNCSASAPTLSSVRDHLQTP
ncbi:inhibitory POU protein isoform X2 [Culex pipiens pallens]|uniref:inhibitory POU protein isoform X2 n=1 Tax=Culex pipiens pallens TaxID=42434 RepID=UPI0019543F81|nr:inhibitory POU protein isoform X2 [Culex pipiens pallens]